MRCSLCEEQVPGEVLLDHMRLQHYGPETSESEYLLHEWYEWWANTDDAPVKMPAALHIRTALFLQEKGRDITFGAGPVA